MLHELLLALSGCEGDIIILKDDGFYLDKDLPFLHESEKEIIDELCKLGYYYRLLTKFVHDNSIQQYILAKNYDRMPPSSYVRALCAGIEEVLDAYLNTLTQFEQRVLIDPIMPLSYLKQALREFEILFPQLHQLAHHIQTQNVRGGYLLDYIHKQTYNGIPVIRNALTRLMFHCNVAMLRHLTTWIVYGVLPDAKYSEFFIVEEVLEEDKQILSTSDEKKKFLSTWKQQYTIGLDRLPSYITEQLAEKILFIGKSIKVLQQSARYDRQGSTQAIPQSELLQFAENIRAHEQSATLHIVAFELTIDRIRSVVAKYLWDLVVIDSDLFGQLAAFKNYFLLSKGDLYQTFIDDAHALMALMPPQNAEQDIKFLYKQAAKKSTAENDMFFDRVRISLGPRKSNSTNVLEVWTEIVGLDYDVKWPLHLLFNSDSIEKYDLLFKLLFMIKRVQCEVQKAWQPLVHRKAKSEQSTEITMLLMLRSRMAFLIDNLQFYLHVDVIDVQYEILTQKIKSTKDFEVALRAHENYLKKITNQCFLNKKQIQVFKKLFEMAMQLCEIVSSEFSSFEREQRKEETSLLTVRIQELTDAFDRQSNLLFQLLSGQKVLSPHLAQLLVRLDYNKYFSTHLENTSQVSYVSGVSH
jgi:gamma-tubulin complex component 4